MEQRSMEVKQVNLEALARPEILRLQPYVGKNVPNVVRMDANENPFPWPKGLKEELFATAWHLNRYPDGGARQLKEALAGYTGVPVDGLLTGNGSDEIIQILYLAFGGPGRSVLLHPPTFTMYHLAARLFGTQEVNVPLQADLSLDLERMLQAARAPEVSMVIICNPNNPTGTVYPREQILELVAASGKIVIVDEAYAEFSGETLISDVPNYPNLLIMRTFSKAFAMAGLRLGYLIGQPATIELVNRAREPYNVNSFSQQAGILALRYVQEYARQVEIIKAETAELYRSLSELPGVQAYPTRTNFILFRPEDADYWAKELQARGYLVRNMGDLPVVGKCLRASAGLPEENRGFIRACREIAGA